MLRNNIVALRSHCLRKVLFLTVLKKSLFFRKAQIIKKIKHFHEEERSKAFQAFKERRKKIKRKRNAKE